MDDLVVKLVTVDACVVDTCVGDICVVDICVVDTCVVDTCVVDTCVGDTCVVDEGLLFDVVMSLLVCLSFRVVVDVSFGSNEFVVVDDIDDLVDQVEPLDRAGVPLVLGGAGESDDSILLFN